MKFDVTKIIEEIKKALARHPVKIIEYNTKPIYDGGSIPIRYKVSMDFQISIVSNEISTFENNNKARRKAFGKKDMLEELYKKYVSILNRLLENIEGIDYVPSSCNSYEMIYYEGQKIHT